MAREPNHLQRDGTTTYRMSYWYDAKGYRRDTPLGAQLAQALKEAAEIRKIVGNSIRDSRKYKLGDEATCHWCLKVFTQRSPTSPFRYCSPACRRKQRNWLRRERRKAETAQAPQRGPGSAA